MKTVLEYGKWLLISMVFSLMMLTIVIVLIEWKSIVDPVFTCTICKGDFWWFPRKVTIMGQEMEICRTCVQTICELGQQIESLFG